jgi:hypothetical protein
LQEWLTAFDVKLVGINISKNRAGYLSVERKIRTLDQVLFPNENITFKNLLFDGRQKIGDVFQLKRLTW